MSTVDPMRMVASMHRHGQPRLHRRFGTGLTALLLCALALLLSAWAPALAAQTASPAPVVVEILFHDTLQDVSAQELAESLDAAAKQHPTLILLNLSTPGGLANSAKRMALSIQQSPVPVVVYVREPKTHVSGEGLRLLQAGDLRAVHPESALLPIIQGASRHHDVAPEEASLLADLQANAARRGRPANGLAAMFQSRHVSASVALQDGAVDAIATTEQGLLNQIDGVTIHRANGQAEVLHLRNAQFILVPMTAREHIMRALMNPDLTVLLLALGGLLIYLEVNTPGGVIPGAAGILLVLLAVYALFHMPLRWEAVLLLILAGMLLLAEAHFQRGFIFAMLAMALLVIGLRLLVDGPVPELEVNWGTAIGAGIGFGGVTAGLLMLGFRARRAKVRTGAEAMLGWLAVTQTALAPEGEVLVRGELWRAKLSPTSAFLPAGESVKVERAHGTVLEVAPLPGLQGT